MNQKYFLAALSLLVSTICSMGMASELSVDEILPRLMHDVKRGVGTEEFFELLENDTDYLTKKDSHEELLLDKVLEDLKEHYVRFGAQKNQLEEADSEGIKEIEALEKLFTFMLSKGKKNDQGKQLVRERWQRLNREPKTPSKDALEALFLKEYPELNPDFGKKKAPRVAVQRKVETSFLELEPSKEVFDDAKKFIDLAVRLNISTSSPFEDLKLPQDLTYTLPGSDDPLPVLIAKHILREESYPGEEKVSLQQFEDILIRGKHNPHFKWHLNKLLEFFRSHAYDAQELITRTNRVFEDQVQFVYERFVGGFRFPKPALDAQQELEKKCACYHAHIFELFRRKGHRFSHFIKKHPQLVHATNETGLPLIHGVLKMYLYHCGCEKRYASNNSMNTYHADEKNRLKALFGQLVFAGASTDRSAECYTVLCYADRANPRAKRYVYEKQKEPYPSIQDILTGRKAFEVNYRDLSTDPCYVEGKQELLSLMELDRDAFIKKYPHLKSYIPDSPKKSQKSSPSSKQKQTGQRNDVEEQKPTFFDSWKGTLKFLGAGILTGAAVYYGVKRYYSSPEDLYKNTRATVA